jgi:hypothetical protein
MNDDVQYVSSSSRQMSSMRIEMHVIWTCQSSSSSDNRECCLQYCLVWCCHRSTATKRTMSRKLWRTIPRPWPMLSVYDHCRMQKKQQQQEVEEKKEKTVSCSKVTMRNFSRLDRNVVSHERNSYWFVSTNHVREFTFCRTRLTIDINKCLVVRLTC